MKKIKFSTLLLLGLMIHTPSVHALDVQLFEPNFDQEGGITIQNTEMLQKWQTRPSLFMNWVRNPIEFGVVANDSRAAKIVGWFMTTDFIFAIGIRDDLSLGIDLPMNFGSSVDKLGTISTKKGFNIGDVTLSGKYLLYRKTEDDKKYRPSVAIIPFVTLPSGKNDVFFGNAGPVGGFRAAFDWQLATLHKLSANLGARFRSTETVLNLQVGPELTWGIGYQYLLWQKHELNLLAELYGSTSFAKFASEEISSPMELLIGLNKSWADGEWISTFGFGRGGNNGYGAPDVRVYAGISYVGKHQTSVPTKNVDTDGDGIFDNVDKCPDQPEDKDGFEDTDGCPDPDNDHDGVLDANDKCPDQPETINGVTDDDGCPDEGKVKVLIQGSKIVILDKIYFATGKADILDKSNSILDQVATTLIANPQIHKIRVEGHTDDRGNDASNMKLSQLRADNVKDHLIKSGIDPARLEAVGYGETKPIDTNKTSEGRERNRRVEFTIIDPVQEEQKVEKTSPVATPVSEIQTHTQLSQDKSIQDQPSILPNESTPVPTQINDDFPNVVTSPTKKKVALIQPSTIEETPSNQKKESVFSTDTAQQAISIPAEKVEMVPANSEQNKSIPVEVQTTATGPQPTILEKNELNRAFPLQTSPMIEKVYFETSQDHIDSDYETVLNHIASTIQTNPQIEKVEIDGHADSRGTKRFNQRLSENRSKKVKDYLINAGTDPNKLKSIGYGELRPIDTNSTPEGQQHNRRVEFKILNPK